MSWKARSADSGLHLLPASFRTFLRRDRIFLAGAAVWLLAVIPPFLPGVSGDLAYFISVFVAEVPVLATLLVVALLSGSAEEDAAGRRFRHLLAWGLAAWLAVRVVYLAVGPEGKWTLPLELGTDVLYLALYFALLLAVALRPHRRRHRRLLQRLWSLERTALLLLAFGAMAYFVLIPAAVDRGAYGSWVPSIALFTLLDLAVAGRAAHEWAGIDDASPWRTTYGWIAATGLLWSVGDGLDALYLTGVIPWIEAGTPLDLVWWAPHLTLLLALRSRAWAPATESPAGAEGARDEAGVRTFGGVEGPEDEDRLPEGFSRAEAGHPLPRVSHPVLYVMAFPLVHVLVQVLELMSPASLRIRELCVVTVLVLLGAVAFVHQRLLRRETERLDRARRRNRRGVESARRLEAVGRLAAGVAHDFNNLLEVIRGRAELIRDGGSDSDARTDARKIIDAVRRGSRVVDRLVAFGQRRRSGAASVDLDRLLPELEGLLVRLLPATVELRVETPGRPLPAPLSRGAAEQVVVNLVLNARDAVDPGGWIRIEAHRGGPDDADDGGDSDGPGREEGVVLRVSDGGRGMTPDVVDRVFEPFFTTKRAGRGTGLGLSSVHGTVEEAGGRIHVDSEPGRGTEVTVFLPSSGGEASAGTSSPSRSRRIGP